MISINGVTLTFDYIGYFDTDEKWEHPQANIETHELILVTEGTIYMQEANSAYTLQKGDMIYLQPHETHFGYKESTRSTSFYWLHFYTNDVSYFKIPKICSLNNFTHVFKEMMHLFHNDNLPAAELALGKFLLDLNQIQKFKNKFAYEMQEYIRIRVDDGTDVTIDDLVAQYGYSSDHLARLYKREFGYSLKSGIVKLKLNRIKSLLSSTNYSIVEIAQQCGFEDDNSFIKFFKYHTNTTPSNYRNKYYKCFFNKH